MLNNLNIKAERTVPFHKGTLPYECLYRYLYFPVFRVKLYSDKLMPIDVLLEIQKNVPIFSAVRYRYGTNTLPKICFLHAAYCHLLHLLVCGLFVFVIFLTFFMLSSSVSDALEFFSNSNS